MTYIKSEAKNLKSSSIAMAMIYILIIIMWLPILGGSSTAGPEGYSIFTYDIAGTVNGDSVAISSYLVNYHNGPFELTSNVTDPGVNFNILAWSGSCSSCVCCGGSSQVSFGGAVTLDSRFPNVDDPASTVVVTPAVHNLSYNYVLVGQIFAEYVFWPVAFEPLQVHVEVNFDAWYTGPTDLVSTPGYSMLLHQLEPDKIEGTYRQRIYREDGTFIWARVKRTYTYENGLQLPFDENLHIQIESISIIGPIDEPHVVYTHGYSFYTPSTPVGGIWVPVDKLGLMAPYIALAIAVVAVALGAVSARKRWLGKAVLPKP